jgi:DNA-directed RNA polymerase specialized sigma24 family protein
MPRRSWTRLEPGWNPQKLEAVLRHYFKIREFYETTGQDEIKLDNGIVVNVHDILRGIPELPKRQREALVLTCVYQLPEKEAARFMGLMRGSSTVGLYKKHALAKLMPLWTEDDEE